jgi:hypothetical protein
MKIYETSNRHCRSRLAVCLGSTIGYLIGGYVVRHHSPDDQDASSYALLPVFDSRTHAYGMTISFTPNGKQIEQMERVFQRFSSIFNHKVKSRDPEGIGRQI